MSDGWHEVTCDDLEFQASKDKAEEKLKISRAMSTQWKKLSEEQPRDNQPVWIWYSTWPTGEPARCHVFRYGVFDNPNCCYWQPAEPPPAPPDGSLAAFNEWWSNYGAAPTGSFLTAKEFSKVAWDAALAWHKNKTKE